MSYADEEIREFVVEEFFESARKGTKRRRLDLWRHVLKLGFQRQYEKTTKIKVTRKRGYRNRYWRDKMLRVTGMHERWAV